MSNTRIISLQGYRAHRRVQRLRRLPVSLRTPQRVAPALEAITAYAWESTVPGRPADPARICRRLEEFVPTATSGVGEWRLVHWLYDNLVPEAWDTPSHLKPLLRDCLRES